MYNVYLDLAQTEQKKLLYSHIFYKHSGIKRWKNFLHTFLLFLLIYINTKTLRVKRSCFKHLLFQLLFYFSIFLNIYFIPLTIFIQEDNFLISCNSFLPTFAFFFNLGQILFFWESRDKALIFILCSLADLLISLWYPVVVTPCIDKFN